MYVVNPLVSMLHLKDLETRAASLRRTAALKVPSSEPSLPRLWLAAAMRSLSISLRSAAVRPWPR